MSYGKNMCWFFSRNANDLEEDWVPINRFNPDTFLCLFQARTGGVMVSRLTPSVAETTVLGRHVAPIGDIILIPSQAVFAFSHLC
jgi:hypothetical protein